VVKNLVAATYRYLWTGNLPAGCDQSTPVKTVNAYVPLLTRHHLTAHEHHGGMNFFGPDVIIRAELVVYLLGVLTDDAANLPPDGGTQDIYVTSVHIM
jgi:hypothetical protein